jgi:hypothetical protein
MRRQLSAAFREHLVDAYVDVTSLFLAMEAMEVEADWGTEIELGVGYQDRE